MTTSELVAGMIVYLEKKYGPNINLARLTTIKIAPDAMLARTFFGGAKEPYMILYCSQGDGSDVVVEDVCSFIEWAAAKQEQSESEGKPLC